MSFICPPKPAIETIPEDVCPQNIGQVQKFGVQREKNAGVANWIPIADAPTLATYTALKAAADGTKMQFSPFFGAPTSEAGEARTFGGGNETPGGVEFVIGRNPSNFSGSFQRLKQSIIEALKTYEGEKDLRVILLNEHGWLIGEVDDHDNPTQFRGLPIQAFFVQDLTLGGFENVDANAFQWQFKPNWSDKLHIVVPTFDPLSQLS